MSDVIARLRELSDRELLYRLHALIDAAEALRRIMDDLPSRRDWLDPDVERMAREALARLEKESA